MLIHTLAQWLAYVASLKLPPAVSRNALMSPWWPMHQEHGPYAAGLGVPTSSVVGFVLVVLVLVAIVCVCISRGLRAARHQRLN